jgi:hypothetical protein
VTIASRGHITDKTECIMFTCMSNMSNKIQAAVLLLLFLNILIYIVLKA